MSSKAGEIILILPMGKTPNLIWTMVFMQFDEILGTGCGHSQLANVLVPIPQASQLQSRFNKGWPWVTGSWVTS